MLAVANILSGLVAVLHIYFLVLEMFLWTKPRGLKVFGQTLEQARATAVLAANQGLYNGFLAAGLIWSFWEDSLHARIFFLLCVSIAGIYGGWSVNRKILLVQGLPALLALGLILASLSLPV